MVAFKTILNHGVEYLTTDDAFSRTMYLLIIINLRALSREHFEKNLKVVKILGISTRPNLAKHQDEKKSTDLIKQILKVFPKTQATSFKNRFCHTKTI